MNPRPDSVFVADAPSDPMTRKAYVDKVTRQQIAARVFGDSFDRSGDRLDAHVEAVSSCCARIVEVKQALRGALDGRGGSALDLARELDSLERVSERAALHARLMDAAGSSLSRGSARWDAPWGFTGDDGRAWSR